MEDNCFDQIGFTLPFYTSVSYSIGALLGKKVPIRSHLGQQLRFWTVFGIGFVVLVATIFEFMQMSRQGWGWILVPAAAIQAGMGGFLIFVAFKMRHPHGDFTASV